MSAAPQLILAADDEESDRLILNLAFEAAGLDNPLLIVRDGREAVDYLAGLPPYTNRMAHPLPALLLLDLKMPRMDGLDVLAWLRSRPDFKHLPVVVFSTSSRDKDIERARQLGARDYFVKPHSLCDYTKIFHEINTRWLRPPVAERQLHRMMY